MALSAERLALSCGLGSLAKTLMLDTTAALAKLKAASHHSTTWTPVSSNDLVGQRPAPAQPGGAPSRLSLGTTCSVAT
jgi:hypothetical protein